MTAPLLEVRDLHARYGAVEVLRGISFDVFPGEIVALIGANGAGKTTALMALSGVVPVPLGTVRFHGELVQDLPAEERVSRGMTQIPEGRRVFPRMSVRENLLMGAATRRDGPEVSKDLRWVLDLFQVLEQRQGQLAGTLSGGEQQMLALGRGLMARPKLLMLDEPSLGLAPKAVTALFETIRKIHALGITILLVEQNAYQALQVAQRAFVLETGSIVLQGSAADLRKDPAVKKAYLGG